MSLYCTYKVLFTAIKEELSEHGYGDFTFWETASQLLVQHQIAAMVVPDEYVEAIRKEVDDADYLTELDCSYMLQKNEDYTLLNSLEEKI